MAGRTSARSGCSTPTDEVEVRVPGAAPAVAADPDLLTRTLANLLENAINHDRRAERVVLPGAVGLLVNEVVSGV